MTTVSTAWRGVVISTALAAAGYLVFSLWGGWRDVVDAVARVGWAGTFAMLLLSCVNYALRFARWQLYLGAQGHHIPWRPSLAIYIGGFALTTTPGKAGEAMRAVFLKPLGVSYGTSMAVFVSERLSDLLSVVALACLGLALYPAAWPLVAAGGVAVVLLLLLLANGGRLEGARARYALRPGKRARVIAVLLQWVVAAKACHRPRVLALASVLSLLAWGAEALAFYLMMDWLGLTIDAVFAVFVYAASMLAGALSFLPGGLGGAEATMVGLLLWAGEPHAPSVAATVLIRLTTLWFAVVIGGIALAGLMRRPALQLRADPSKAGPG